jgi:hypothetical protein
MQNGELARMMGMNGMNGMNNPFSMYGGGGMPGFGAMGGLGLPGGPGTSLLNRAAVGLQSKQISNLWMNNAPESFRAASAEATEDEEAAAEDEDDMGVIETYSNYMPTKLKVR